MACITVSAMSLADEIVEKVCAPSPTSDEPRDDLEQWRLQGGATECDDLDLLGAAAREDRDEAADGLSEFIDDNVSLEVNFGDGGSCRASNISSLSYQNIVLDNPETVQYQESIGIRYRRDSLSESSISPQNEFFTDADSAAYDDRRFAEDLVPRRALSPGYDNVDMATGDSDNDEINTGTMKRRIKLSCATDDVCATNNGDGCSGSGGGGRMRSGTNPTNTFITCNDRPSRGRLQDNRSSDAPSGQQVAGHHQQSLVSLSGSISDGDFSKTDLLLRSPDEEVAGSREKVAGSREMTLKKRNSLEIRNNIPDVSEVKNYGDMATVTSLASSNMAVQSTVPTMKKKSPGLARRLPDAIAEFMDRDSSSSEREDPPLDVSVVSAQKYFDQHCQNGSTTSGRDGKASQLIGNDNRRDTEDDLDQSGPDLASLEVEESIEVENEYDYVKYARIQQGSSYVGMRLAYSENSVNHSDGADGQYPLDMSREMSPAAPNQLGAPPRNGMVNEDLLTEISLTSDQPQGDEPRHFTLSPEATECDSAEVESVISEEGGKSSSLAGMPAVEDGLSSSQASDVEEASHDGTTQPADILRQRCKADIGPPRQAVDDNGLHSPYHEETFGRRRRALDSAIRDIQTAIERSKTKPEEDGVQQADGVEDEPVWVKRDNCAPKPSNREILRKAHETLYRQKEDGYRDYEADKVYSVEDEDESLLKYQYTRNDGKSYRSPIGYDSDTECSEHDRHLVAQTRRRNKGKKYASIASDDPVDYAYFKAVSDRYHGHGDDRGSHTQSPKMSHSDPNLNRECLPGGAVAVGFVPSRYTDDRNVSRSSQRSYRQNELFPGSPVRSVSSSDIAGGDRTELQHREQNHSSEDVGKVNTYIRQVADGEFDTEDEETEDLLDKQYGGIETVDIPELSRPVVSRGSQSEKRRSKTREALINDPDDHEVLIEGVLFRARYLGSTQLISDGHPSKSMRMMQAQEAVGRIKTLGTLHFGEKYQAPAGEAQPSTEVDLFVSTEKIMILNTDLQEVMMDHSLRTISYIADIGEILVVMARRGPVVSTGADGRIHQKRQSKVCCHVFESEEAQLIAQSIGQAFQVAYMEFLKANGIDDPSLIKEIDYQEVLNQQEIYGEELYLFSNRDMQKEVIVPKLKGEPLGVVIVESGWGSMVPTVVLANMCPSGAAARCGQMNIGDQIMSVNGISLVGLPLSSCQTYMKTARNQTVVKLTTVSCPPVVEVLIKRPDVKYQLGFSVQNGVICSLLRGGIAERGGVRVGHRIIEINSQSVVAVPHEKIVTMLATSVGEIHMKTMPTSIFRLLTGQDTPHYI